MMNKKYSIFCLFIFSVQNVWAMENSEQNTPNITNHNYLEITSLHLHRHHSQNSHDEQPDDMNWQEKAAYSLEQGGWHAVEQIPIMIMSGIVNISLQKLVNYLESGNAQDTAFAQDINDVEKQEVFRSLLKNQLAHVDADQEELTKQIAACSNKTERATLQKILEQKKEYRTKITQQYHQFAHQQAENVMNFVDKYK